MTAVEWLEDKIQSDMTFMEILGLIKQAKAMEKENIKQTWQESRKIKSECSNWNCIGDEKFYQSFEQYYKETFKSE